MDLVALEEAARARLDASVYDYYAGGADDEFTAADNVAAWSRVRLRPHVLRDVSVVDTATTVLGTPVRAPILVAPWAYQRMADEHGECATARAAARAGTVAVFSTLATVSLEDVAAAAPGASRWFQLYVHTDRGFSRELVERAAAAGYGAVVLTVDLPRLGNRRRDERNRFTLPAGIQMANIGAVAPSVDGSGIAAYAAAEMEAGLTPDDVTWLAGLSELPVVVKGVLRGDDAQTAVAAGAAGVIVSNHGGRQLDTAVATCDALGEVAEAVGDGAEVLVDGGVRRGTDVLKALALGARAVLVGRPLVWGLATGGEDGVVAVLDGLGSSLALAMALAGTPSVADVAADLVVPSPTATRP